MVVLVHCLVCYRVEIFKQGEYELVDFFLIFISGRAPVILFFVLSGFVLAASQESIVFSFRNLSYFYLKRLKRLLPAAYAGLLFSLFVYQCARQFAVEPKLFLKDWIGNPYLSTYRDLTDSLLFSSNFINPAYWTLHVELVGSFLLPIVVVLIRYGKWWRWVTILCFISLPFFPFHFTNLGRMTNALIYSFVAGVLLFFLLREKELNLRHSYVGLMGLILLLLSHSVIGPTTAIGKSLGSVSGLSSIIGTDNNLALFVQHFLETVGAFLIVGHVVQRENPLVLLNARPIAFMGRVSYSLYIFHLPVLAIVVLAMNEFYNVQAGEQGYGITVLTFVFVMLIVIPLSYVSWRLFEKPFLSRSQNRV